VLVEAVDVNMDDITCLDMELADLGVLVEHELRRIGNWIHDSEDFLEGVLEV